jgi:hypothetical protein
MLEQLSNGNATQQAASALETHTNTGSGDDKVEINADGKHDVELGSGDDEVFVNFEKGEATIHGGSGDDTVNLSGFEWDYEVHQEGEYTVYTDSNGQSVRIADDVETVKFDALIETRAESEAA